MVQACCLDGAAHRLIQGGGVGQGDVGGTDGAVGDEAADGSSGVMRLLS